MSASAAEVRLSLAVIIEAVEEGGASSVGPGWRSKGMDDVQQMYHLVRTLYVEKPHTIHACFLETLFTFSLGFTSVYLQVRIVRATIDETI